LRLSSVGLHFACYSLPRIALAIAKTVIFYSCYFFFSVHRFFDVPELILTKLCRDAVYALKVSMSYRGVHCSDDRRLLKEEEIGIMYSHLNIMNTAHCIA